MLTSASQVTDRLKRLRKRFPEKSDEELLAVMRFWDRYIEIALSIYLEATEPSSHETVDMTEEKPDFDSGF